MSAVKGHYGASKPGYCTLQMAADVLLVMCVDWVPCDDLYSTVAVYSSGLCAFQDGNSAMLAGN